MFKCLARIFVVLALASCVKSRETKKINPAYFSVSQVQRLAAHDHDLGFDPYFDRIRIGPSLALPPRFPRYHTFLRDTFSGNSIFLESRDPNSSGDFDGDFLRIDSCFFFNVNIFDATDSVANFNLRVTGSYMDTIIFRGHVDFLGLDRDTIDVAIILTKDNYYSYNSGWRLQKITDERFSGHLFEANYLIFDNKKINYVSIDSCNLKNVLSFHNSHFTHELTISNSTLPDTLEFDNVKVDSETYS